MFVHHLLVVLPVDHVLVADSSDVGTDMTPMRLWATSAALLALIGVVVGSMALMRAVRRVGNGGRDGAVLALASGGIAVVAGVGNLAVADGGPGTGNGVVGGGLAIVLGLAATVLGSLVLRRSRQAAQQPGLASRRP